MSERTEERERTRTRDSRSDLEFETDVDIEGLLSDSGGRSGTERTTNAEKAAETERRGLRTRLRDRRRGLFSLRVFAGMLVLALGTGLLGGFVPIPLVSGLAGLLGVFVAAFVVGLASSERHYVESGLAGAAAAGLILVVSNLNVVVFAAFRDIVPEIGVIGAGAGLLAALLGHYFGRDLHEGLTTDI